MEQRTPKQKLTLRKKIPASNPAPTPNVEPHTQHNTPESTQDHATADASPMEWLEVDEYYSQRKKPRTNKRTHRNTPTRNELRWQ
jgi:hypothetical protein